MRCAKNASPELFYSITAASSHRTPSRHPRETGGFFVFSHKTRYEGLKKGCIDTGAVYVYTICRIEKEE